MPRFPLIAAVLILVASAVLAACRDAAPEREVGEAQSREQPAVVSQTSQRVDLSYHTYESPAFGRTIGVGGSEQDAGVGLVVTCSGQLEVFVSPLPYIDANSGMLTVALDDGTAEDVPVALRETWKRSDEARYTRAILDAGVWYERLRAAETMTVDFETLAMPATFDLTRVFSTPLQADLEACAAGSFSAGSASASSVDPPRGAVWHIVTEQVGVSPVYHFIAIAPGDGSELFERVKLMVTCSPDSAAGRLIHVTNIPWFGERSATMVVSVDGVASEELPVSLEQEPGWLPDGVRAVGVIQLDAPTWYPRLRDAEVVTLELRDSGVGLVTFDLARLFSSKLQADFDACVVRAASVAARG